MSEVIDLQPVRQRDGSTVWCVPQATRRPRRRRVVLIVIVVVVIWL